MTATRPSKKSALRSTIRMTRRRWLSWSARQHPNDGFQFSVILIIAVCAVISGGLTASSTVPGNWGWASIVCKAVAAVLGAIPGASIGAFFSTLRFWDSVSSSVHIERQRVEELDSLKQATFVACDVIDGLSLGDTMTRESFNLVMFDIVRIGALLSTAPDKDENISPRDWVQAIDDITKQGYAHLGLALSLVKTAACPDPGSHLPESPVQNAGYTRTQVEQMLADLRGVMESQPVNAETPQD